MEKTSIKFGQKSLYVNPNTGNIKTGSKELAQPIAKFFGKIEKGEARKIRKSLRKEGYASLASVSRAA